MSCAYIAVGRTVQAPHYWCWAKSKTISLAKASLAREAGKGAKAIVVWRCDPLTVINELGDLEWPKGATPPAVVEDHRNE